MALVVGAWAYTTHVKRVGALEVLLHQADSVAKVRLAEQQLAHDSAVQARQRADSVEGLLGATRRAVRAAGAKVDSARAVLASVRDSALAIGQDSSKTLTETRAILSRLIQVSDSAEAAHTAERLAWVRDSTASARVLREKNVAIDRGVDAENAAIARAVAAESQVALLKKSRPSTFWRVAERAAWAGAVVYLAARP